MNSIELKYYLFMIQWTKCAGSCNDLSPKLCVSKETKDINVKGLAIITKKDEGKAKTKHISSYCNYNM